MTILHRIRTIVHTMKVIVFSRYIYWWVIFGAFLNHCSNETDNGSNETNEQLPEYCHVFSKDSVIKAPLFYGHPNPGFLAFGHEQQKAIGYLEIHTELVEEPALCTATLIADKWVLTIFHCLQGESLHFCVKDEKDGRAFAFNPIRTVLHPELDLVLLELDRDPADETEVKPIPVITEPVGHQWIGQRVQASGFGLTEYYDVGRRLYVVEEVIDVRETVLTIDGAGGSGACVGDSGGPLLARVKDGSVRVLGALSEGSESCLDIDQYTRVDIALDWIESYTGQTRVEPALCGALDERGRCFQNRALWCASGTLQNKVCTDRAQSCGWSIRDAGFRCIDARRDPCEGVDEFGECRQNSVHYCEDGVLKTIGCEEDNERCTIDSSGHATCGKLT